LVVAQPDDLRPARVEALVVAFLLFYMRSVQTVLMLLAVPLFLALGRPLSLFIAVFPRAGQRLQAAIGSRPARLLTFPPITTFVLVLTPFLVYFTPWYAAGFTAAERTGRPRPARGKS
jgi:cytochrome c oxidase assembly factor CtaG